MARLNQGVWYYPGKLPAIVVKVHSPSMVDVVVDESGTVYSRTSVSVWSGSGSAPQTYVTEAAADDQPDLDRIAADRGYGLPGQQGGADQGGPSDDSA